MVALPPPPRVSGASWPRRPDDESAEGGQDHDDDRVQDQVLVMFEKPFAVGPQRCVAGESLQQDGVCVFEPGEERRPHQARGEADERGVKQGPTQEPEVQGRRHDAQRSGQAGPPTSIPLSVLPGPMLRASAIRAIDWINRPRGRRGWRFELVGRGGLTGAPERESRTRRQPHA